MKTLRFVFLLVVLTASATILLAQSGASPAPSAQPTTTQNTSATQPSAEKKSLTAEEKQAKETELNELMNKYSTKGNWYLVFYYIFVLGAALAAALAGLLLQFDTPEKSYKRPAQILAFVGSALAIVTTSVNFKVQSNVSNTAYWELRELRDNVSEGKITDMSAINDAIRAIERRKSDTARN